MPREPIIIGLDESPIVIQGKGGKNWSFNPDPQPDFLVKMMDIARALQTGDVSEYVNMTNLLADQLTPATQRKQWNTAKLGVAWTKAMFMAYMEELNNLPTKPSSQSGKPRGGDGPKS